MLSVRSLARFAPRSARTFSSRCLRPAQRSFVQQRSSPLQFVTPQRYTPFQSIAAFSSSRNWREEGQVNLELAAKLDSEISLEREIRDPDQFPSHLKEYLDNTPFELHDVQGRDEVVLTRKFNDETIRVTFSVDDLNQPDEDPNASLAEDEAFQDEMGENALDAPTDTQSGGANTKGSINQGRTSGGNFKVAPEDRVAPGDRSELANEEDNEGDESPQSETSFPAHLNITVSRPGRGSIQFEAIAQDGLVVIENVSYFTDPKQAEPQNVQDEWSRRDQYTGPPFHNLDEDLQVMFERYLDERGVNTTLALFIPEYIDWKEQKEYLNWLDEVRKFVE